MSSFIVDNSTINRIVGMLEWAAKSHSNNYPNPKYNGELLLVQNLEEAEVLGLALYSLNVQAVNIRYPDTVGKPNRMPGSIDESGNHVPYKFIAKFPGNNRIQNLKSLQCLIYQCSEGNVTNEPLYKSLREYEFGLCRAIVQDMPEYDLANWG